MNVRMIQGLHSGPSNRVYHHTSSEGHGRARIASTSAFHSAGRFAAHWRNVLSRGSASSSANDALTRFPRRSTAFRRLNLPRMSSPPLFFRGFLSLGILAMPLLQNRVQQQGADAHRAPKHRARRVREAGQVQRVNGGERIDCRAWLRQIRGSRSI